MAFRKSMFENCGGVRTDLERCGAGLPPLANENTEGGGRLLAGGGRLRYEPLRVSFMKYMRGGTERLFPKKMA